MRYNIYYLFLQDHRAHPMPPQAVQALREALAHARQGKPPDPAPPKPPPKP